MKRLLITGAAGFIGTHAVQPAIEAGFDVRAVTRRDADLLDETQTARLLDENRPTHLLHLAWYVAPEEYWTSPANGTWADASERLFRMFVERGGERITGIGSSAEHNALHTPYGRAKSRTCAAALASGVSAAWGRLYMVYGPGEPPARFVPTMIRTLLRGGTGICTPGNGARDLIHVVDAARAAVKIAASDTTGLFDIGTGIATPLGDVVRILTRELGHAERITIDSETAPPVVADIRRLHDEIGFRPRFTLEDGLRDTIAWWRDQ